MQADFVEVQSNDAALGPDVPTMITIATAGVCYYAAESHSIMLCADIPTIESFQLQCKSL